MLRGLTKKGYRAQGMASKLILLHFVKFKICLMEHSIYYYFFMSLDVQGEIKYLGQLRHPNRVKLIIYWIENDHKLKFTY